MVEIHGINFNVEIEKKKIKNIYLRVDGNTIYATCPYYVADYKVYNFIETKKNWIYKVYLYNEKKLLNSFMYYGGDTFNILSKPYKLIRSIGPKKIDIVDETIYFQYKDDSYESIKALYKYLDKLLISQANEYLNLYLPMLKDYGYNLIPELKARIMKGKWGVCYVKNNRITVSSYLIHYPIECLQYIMIHEMTHFIVPNHSKRFYEIIANNMPNYIDASNKLK